MVMTLVIVLSNSMEKPITCNIVCFWLIQDFVLFRPKRGGNFWEVLVCSKIADFGKKFIKLSLPIDDVKGF